MVMYLYKLYLQIYLISACQGWIMIYDPLMLRFVVFLFKEMSNDKYLFQLSLLAQSFRNINTNPFSHLSLCFVTISQELFHNDTNTTAILYALTFY